jgi:peptidoglycan pentaglycine glycine transferase (the first glycine)
MGGQARKDAISMQAQVINDRDQWNSFVAAAATGYITQTYEWSELGDLLGGEFVRLGVVEDGMLRAAMLVEIFRMPPLGLRYLYVPRGPVLDDPDSPALPALMAEARRLARRRGAFMLKIEPNVPDGDARWLRALERLGFRRNPHATHPRRSWVVDVRPSEPELLANMKMTWRYNIRAAERKGVRVREATTPEEFDVWYRLYQETAARDGFFIHSRELYAAVLNRFRAHGAAAQFLAEYEGTPIAGLIVARCGPVATSMYSASSNQHRDRRPNHLLQWTGMRWAKAQGCALYDFRAIAEKLEPTAPDYSLYTYKEGFGGYSVLTLEGHDLPFNPLLYGGYRASLAAKRAVVYWRVARRQRARQRASAAKEAAGPPRQQTPPPAEERDAPRPPSHMPTSGGTERAN